MATMGKKSKWLISNPPRNFIPKTPTALGSERF
jgi:hypothetical protein